MQIDTRVELVTEVKIFVQDRSVVWNQSGHNYKVIGWYAGGCSSKFMVN